MQAWRTAGLLRVLAYAYSALTTPSPASAVAPSPLPYTMAVFYA